MAGRERPSLDRDAEPARRNSGDGNQLRTFDLIAYKGQSVTLSFAMREDRSKQTSFVLDKVSLLTR